MNHGFARRRSGEQPKLAVAAPPPSPTKQTKPAVATPPPPSPSPFPRHLPSPSNTKQTKARRCHRPTPPQKSKKSSPLTQPYSAENSVESMLTSSRDNWERLVAAVVKRQQIWELCHQQSRTPSICSTITSDDDDYDDLSEQFPSFSGANFVHFSVPPSPLHPSTDPSSSQAIYLFRMLTSSRDNWEKLVAAVVKRQQIRELCHQQSISTIASDDDFSERNLRPPNEPPLDWQTRKRIALGCARGLTYLHDHCDPKIIHRDVKAANIYLDEEFEAVVGDFGLAKYMDYKDTHVTTAVRGTTGHIAPEYLSTGKVSEKSDVYGYGVTLLELISALRAYDLARLANDEDVMLLDWVKGLLKEKKLEKIIDPELQNNYVDEDVEQLIQVALLCTQSSPSERPKMSEVVRLLEGDGLTERWDEWQKLEDHRQEVKFAMHLTSDWIIDSELSGPR